jgi:hypothetical protein
MGWLDSLSTDGTVFPHGSTVYRLRGGMMPDPYNPDAQIPENWDEPDVLEIVGAFIAQTSTSMLRTATREQAVESKSLFCSGDSDLQKGDRIRDGDEGAPVYTIDGIPPMADSNPWTGWTPPREVPLTRYVG